MRLESRRIPARESPPCKAVTSRYPVRHQAPGWRGEDHRLPGFYIVISRRPVFPSGSPGHRFRWDTKALDFQGVDQLLLNLLSGCCNQAVWNSSLSGRHCYQSRDLSVAVRRSLQWPAISLPAYGHELQDRLYIPDPTVETSNCNSLHRTHHDIHDLLSHRGEGQIRSVRQTPDDQRIAGRPQIQLLPA